MKILRSSRESCPCLNDAAWGLPSQCLSDKCWLIALDMPQGITLKPRNHWILAFMQLYQSKQLGSNFIKECMVVITHCLLDSCCYLQLSHVKSVCLPSAGGRGAEVTVNYMTQQCSRQQKSATSLTDSWLLWQKPRQGSESSWTSLCCCVTRPEDFSTLYLLFLQIFVEFFIVIENPDI